MLVNRGGRIFSKRTAEEDEADLRQELAALSPDERAALMVLLTEVEEERSEGDRPLIDIVSEAEFKHPPVDIATFVKDDYYLGNTCSVLYPRWLSDMEELFEGGDYEEVIFTGAIGGGKTFSASVAVCRMLYELSCLRDPHASLGLAPDTDISIVCLSVNEGLAMKVAFENIATKLKASPYFAEHFPYKATRKEFRFPNNVWLAARATTDTSALGLNTLGALVDECVCADTLVSLPGGRVATAEALYESCGPLRLPFRLLSVEGGCPVEADAYIKRSTVQECFEVELDGGQRLRASWRHPVAVLGRDGVLGFKLMRDILPGEEVVTYAEERSEAFGGSKETLIGDSQAADGLKEPVSWAQAYGGSKAQDGGGAEEEDWLEAHGGDQAQDRRGKPREGDVGRGAFQSVAGDEGALGRWRQQLATTAANGGGGQPQLRQASVRGAQAAVARGCDWEAPLGGGATQNVRGAAGQTYAYGSVQAAFDRIQPHSGLHAFGGDTGQDIGVKRLAPEEGRLEVSRPCRDDEGGFAGLSFAVGASSGGDIGGAFGCSRLPLREAVGAVPLGGQATQHCAGLRGRAERRPHAGRRGEAQRLHIQPQGEGEDGSGTGVLRSSGVGIRGMGRAFTVARVVSKRGLGMLPTYDICVPGCEVFIGDGVLVHNSNFLSKGRKIDPRMGAVDHAEMIYNGLKRRMKSRFGRGGRVLGKIFLVSSKKTADDFTARRIREAKEDPRVMVRDYALWDSKPADHFSPERFYVLCGNEQIPSRILDEGEESRLERDGVPDGVTLVAVPVDFKSDFERDLEGSIRDIAGVSTVAVSPFVQRREKLVFDDTRQHPFSVEVYDPSKPGTFIWENLVRKTQMRDFSGYTHESLTPIVNPKAARHIHIDPAYRKDSVGFCMAHISGWKDVLRRAEDGEVFQERQPIYFVDVILRIVPPVGDEIVLGDLRRLVYELSAHGFIITLVTQDTWQSIDALQQLKQKGYAAEHLSVDTKMDPYEALKTAFYEDRINIYRYPTVFKELRELELDAKRQRVDHPKKGSKDTSDALAGCIYTLSQHQATQPLPVLRGAMASADVWMEEQQHAAAARRLSGRHVDSGRFYPPAAQLPVGQQPNVLPPILGGGMGSPGWGRGGSGWGSDGVF